MCDKLVYDLAQEVEGSPSVFIRKDWINILDNQNTNYISNQSVLDTSQLSNSNKWMSYREAYFSIPLTLTLATLNNENVNVNGGVGGAIVPAAGNILYSDEGTMAIGLKNWYGNIIHSFTCDYNGTTIIQQTPFVNMWNSFKLMTSLSYQDVLTQGCTIGFYPDDAQSWEFYQAQSGVNGLPASSRLAIPVAAGAVSSVYSGTGTCNNTNKLSFSQNFDTGNSFSSGLGNKGFYERQKWIAFDPSAAATGISIGGVAENTIGVTYGSLISNGVTGLTNLWKSYISKKQDQVSSVNGPQTTAGIIQYAVMATVYLKHVHSFFNMIPLLKGVFMKMTMNLNNCSSTVVCGGVSVSPNVAGATGLSTLYQICTSVNSNLGGSNIVMLASNKNSVGGTNVLLDNGSKSLQFLTSVTSANNYDAVDYPYVSYNKPYRLNVSVGSKCLDNTITSLPGYGNLEAPLSKSVYLYIPAYTFNPTFEQAYLSSPVKQIKYTDIYQYQVLNAQSGNQINSLLTNGIQNVKSVLILPFYSSQGTSTTLPYVQGATLSNNSGFLSGQSVWTSPFDPAGCGPTSPLCHLTNFNIQVSGQNAIYNLQKYNFEQFNNQLYGQNAVNGGLTDGITSSLVDRQSFDMEYCYYYVNVERMLPVEQSVPKSIQLLGQNMSSKNLDLICFIEYGTEVNIDSLTGSRV